MKRVLLVVLVILSSLRPAQACGPDRMSSVFTFNRHPDFPLANFARGQLGILQPSWARSYLVVAYRHFTGVGMDGTEASAADRLWTGKLMSQWTDPEPWPDPWEAARAQLKAIAPPRSERAHYVVGTDVSAHALMTAAAALRERKEHYDAAAFRQWVEGQDTVFLNRAYEPAILPAPLPPRAPRKLVADREYQTAAALFYAHDNAGAVTAFQKISDDKISAWRALGAFMVARTWVHASYDAEGPAAEVAMEKARQQLRVVLGHAAFKSVHGDAAELLEQLTLSGEELALSQLERRVLRPHSRTLFGDLWQFTSLVTGWNGGQEQPWEDDEEALHRAAVTRFISHEKQRNKHPLVDWLLTLQAQSPQATQHARSRWTRTHATEWLVASFILSQPTDDGVPELLDAARAMPAGSAALPTVAFHRARLLAGRGDVASARGVLESLLALAQVQALPSTRNHALALQAVLAPDAESFFRALPRVPAATSVDNDVAQRPINGPAEHLAPRLDADAAQWLTERIPLDVLMPATLDEKLPPTIRRDILRAALTRAILLENHEAARDSATAMSTLAPEVSNALGEYLAQPDSLGGALLLLRLPGLAPWVDTNQGRGVPLTQMDNYRNNAWCSLKPPQRPEDAYGDYYRSSLKMGRALEGLHPHGTVVTPAFLTQAQQERARADWEAVQKIPTAPDHLASLVLDFAAMHPGDSRLPEALHRAVKLTRYGCTGPASSGFSKRAFRLLHREFPSSPWTERTPFWF